MEFFIQVVLGIQMLRIAIYSAALLITDYPRKHEHTLQNDLTEVVFSVCICVWAYRVLYVI